MHTKTSDKDIKQFVIQKIREICNEDVSIREIKDIQFLSYASTTNHVAIDTGEKKYFASILGSYISRNNLEFEVKLLSSLAQVGFSSVRVAKIGQEYIHKIVIDGHYHRVIFYEYIEGELIPYNQVTRDSIVDIFSKIAQLHGILGTFLPTVGKHGVFHRKSRYTNILLSLNDEHINYLLKKNFNALDEIQLIGIREKWDEYSHLVPKVREYLVNKKRQITHGDLSHANILVTNNDYTFIDFHDSEFAPKEWDLAWAIVHWWKWQEKFDCSELFKLVMEIYPKHLPSVDNVDKLALKEMITVAFLIMLEMGLSKPEVGNDNTQAKHLVETSLYYLYNENIL